jgi:hypothetical protein
MRKTPKDGAGSGAAISLAEALATISQLAERVEELEMAVFGQRMQPKFKSPAQPLQGRKPKVEHAVVLERRDQLAYWIEINWPHLSVALHKAKSSREAISAILHARQVNPVLLMNVPFYEKPSDFESELWEFTTSRRFAGDPRNLAGAMAGLPKLRPKTSLDLCQKSPCERIVDPHAWRDYLRRKFPKRWNELRLVRTEMEFRAILKKTAAKDLTYLYLKEHPKEALDWIIATDPSQPKNTESTQSENL